MVLNRKATVTVHPHKKIFTVKLRAGLVVPYLLIIMLYLKSLVTLWMIPILLLGNVITHQ